MPSFFFPDKVLPIFIAYFNKLKTSGLFYLVLFH